MVQVGGHRTLIFGIDTFYQLTRERMMAYL